MGVVGVGDDGGGSSSGSSSGSSVSSTCKSLFALRTKTNQYVGRRDNKS